MAGADVGGMSVCLRHTYIVPEFERRRDLSEGSIGMTVASIEAAATSSLWMTSRVLLLPMAGEAGDDTVFELKGTPSLYARVIRRSVGHYLGMSRRGCRRCMCGRNSVVARQST